MMLSKKQNKTATSRNEKIDYTIRMNQKIDYKDIDLLARFLTKQGKIRPRRLTGVTIQQQRKLAKAIKRARILSLFPFVASNSG